MSAKLGFGTLLVLLAIFGVWLTVTGRALAIVKAITGKATGNAATSTTTGAAQAGAAAGSAAAGAVQTPSAPTAAPSAPPAQTSVTASGNSLNAQLGSFSLGLPYNGPTFDLSQLNGPIGGDGFAISPMSLSSWGGYVGQQ